MSKNSSANRIYELLYLAFCTAVAMVGYRMHHDIICAIIDFICAPIVLVYWFITHQINLSLIKLTFSFFFK